jgi:hypothetical protein
LTPEALETVLVVSPQEAIKIQSEKGVLIAAFNHMTACCQTGRLILNNGTLYQQYGLKADLIPF